VREVDHTYRPNTTINVTYMGPCIVNRV